MKIQQCQWFESGGWKPAPPRATDEEVQLVLIFGSTALVKARKATDEIRQAFPRAHVLGCTTAGEILGTEIADDSMAVTAVSFERTRVESACVELVDSAHSRSAGVELVKQLDRPGLAHILILSPGLRVNGSELVRGIAETMPHGVSVSGGLAGDADQFTESYVFSGYEPMTNAVSAVGFYGDHIRVGHGSAAGWDPFGPERLVTRSRDNVLYELDGRSALELYKRYLGKHAEGLPATALLFPVGIGTGEDSSRVIRTVLSVDEADQSMTFAGDIPEGHWASLMRANVDQIVDGAATAARHSVEMIDGSQAQLSFLVSCVGRKLVMKQRTEEEVDMVAEAVGAGSALAGFYSYGEIAPSAAGGAPALHNQSMTVTTLLEA